MNTHKMFQIQVGLVQQWLSGFMSLWPLWLLCKVHPAYVEFAELRAVNHQKKAFPGFFVRLM